MLSVSDYLSEQHVKRLNPYQVVGEKTDPAAFSAHREQVVELLGIEALLERNVFQVSNGERRKVLLARALLRRPKLLILDNPFTGLDAEFRVRLKDIVGSLMQGEMRFLFVTNDREQILPDVTHVLVVENGGIVAQGPKDAVLDNARLQKSFSPPPPTFGRRPLPSRGEGAFSPPLGEGADQRSVGKGEILVQMKGVSVAYNGVQVLERIDWTVRQNENWALLGPNGAGKTTLLSLILGDNPQAYANDITLFGRRRGSGESIWDIKAHIGWVAPELHLYYPKRVPCFDVVCSGFFASVGRYHKCSPQQCETATAWMQRLGIEQYADLAFGELSEGEQRLVLIARALVKEPDLLILDEPCQGLDARHRDRVLQAVETIGNHLNTSVIYVTHRLDALPSIITHVLRLDKGRVRSKKRTQ
jgi:molybdate transport system ATP-binding protein